ncbi:MAG: hypothetical protein Q7T45_02010 [Bradyrhizobium sp.]|uniref:hypothetical protein n=1 Tax=Bradyrhizobium sp. TaxID=376 RepID=UPI002719602A|nr:hypothetical protein [Bradyrhizobium sp.]MDO8396571.1 hypothetical protein [Bradyrhizobium sp.]
MAPQDDERHFDVREIASAFQQLSRYTVGINPTAVETEALIAYQLVLAVLSEMEFGIFNTAPRRRSAGLERLKKRKDFIRQHLASHQSHRTHSQVLANWLQSTS